MSSNPNPRRPEGRHHESLPTGDTSRHSDFHPTVLPFRPPGSTPDRKDSYEDETLPNVQADTDARLEPKERQVASTSTSNQAGVDHLDMPGWKTTKVEYKRHETLVHAVLTARLTHCLYTECRSNSIKANGPGREQFIAHTPLDDRPRRIAYRR